VISGWTATGEGALECELICMLQPPSGWEAMGDAGRSDVQGREDFREVVRCGLAFHIGAQCKDDFGGFLDAESFKKWFDAQLRRADMVKWSEASAEGVVQTLKHSTSLQWQDVG